MKSSILRTVMAILFAASGSSFSEQALASVAPQNYVHCNVFASVVCFGIGGGDKLEMSLPRDYVLYSVALAQGPRAVIYDGFNPNFASRRLKALVQRCFSERRDCSFVDRTEDQVEAVHFDAASGQAVHIVITKAERGEVSDADEFLMNFRACRSDYLAARPTCDGPPLFGNP